MTDTNEIERLILQLLRQRGRLTLGAIVAEIRIRLSTATPSEIKAAVGDLMYAQRVESYIFDGAEYVGLTRGEIQRALDDLIK